MTSKETVSSAVEKRASGPGEIVKQYAAEFQQVLPSHLGKDSWVRLAQGLLRKDKNLAQAARQNPGSLMQALMECARLGHEPGTSSFYLVPISGQVEGWEGYRGVIERMYRAGAITAVKAELVKENDEFDYQPEMGRPVHKVDWFSGNRGQTLGAYAYAEMVGGGVSKVVLIDRPYIDKVKAESRGSNSPSSPWRKWEDQMILKTVLHRLEPFVPTSSEYVREKMRVARDVANEDAGAPPVPAQRSEPVDVSHLPEVRDDDPNMIDAEVVDSDQDPT